VEASSGSRTGVHKAVSLKKAPGTAPAGRRETIALRRLLRELRTATAGTKSSTAELLSGDVPSVFRQEAALRVVRSALFRLPERQRELIRRHDLEGEPADALQHSLGLSARQYYRDRRAGLAALSRYLLGTAAWPGDRTVPAAFAAEPPPRPPEIGASVALLPHSNGEFVRQAYARSLFQSGDIACLDVLADLARAVTDPQRRAGLLLDLSEMAFEFDRQDLSRGARRTAIRIVEETQPFDEGDADLLRGRIARLGANYVGTLSEAEQLYTQSLAHLRRSLRSSPMRVDARAQIALTLGDVALSKFGNGAFAEARSASAEACDIIRCSGLWTLPRALEIVAVNRTLEAVVTGRVSVAVQRLVELLELAIELGNSSVAGLVGALMVGLNSTRGKYEEAVRWYDRLASPVACGMRLTDRAHLAMEAAHALSMVGRSAEALEILGYGRAETEWPLVETASRHVTIGQVLVRAGNPTAALAEGQAARRDYEANQVARGLGNAHRLIAICYGRLGDLDRAKDHVREAQRLAETNGTHYDLLRTLVAKAEIVQSRTVKAEAIEFAQMLRGLDDDPDRNER
jgi:tetratricopeptide (TPR) repeat protein